MIVKPQLPNLLSSLSVCLLETQSTTDCRPWPYKLYRTPVPNKFSHILIMFSRWHKLPIKRKFISVLFLKVHTRFKLIICRKKKHFRLSRTCVYLVLSGGWSISRFLLKSPHIFIVVNPAFQCFEVERSFLGTNNLLEIVMQYTGRHERGWGDIMCFMLQENAMNGRHLWMDTDTSGNSCYLNECESLVRIINISSKHLFKSDSEAMSKFAFF